MTRELKTPSEMEDARRALVRRTALVIGFVALLKALITLVGAAQL